MPVLSNAKHEAVVRAFIADGERIGSRAYSAVFPKASPRAAETAWSRLLRRAEFQARVAEVEAEIAAAAIDSAVMSKHEVLAELSKLGRANMQDFLVRGDNAAEVIASLQDLARDNAAAVQELTVETYTEGSGEDAREVKRVKLKLHDKRGALAELRRHYEPQKHELTGKDGKPIETKDLTERPSDIEIARRLAFLLSQATKQETKP
jgi:phage terminase small subunit